jgi:hypothetical protein
MHTRTHTYTLHDGSSRVCRHVQVPSISASQSWTRGGRTRESPATVAVVTLCEPPGTAGRAQSPATTQRARASRRHENEWSWCTHDDTLEGPVSAFPSQKLSWRVTTSGLAWHVSIDHGNSATLCNALHSQDTAIAAARDEACVTACEVDKSVRRL